MIYKLSVSKAYLCSLEQNGIFPIEFEYDSESADAYEESFGDKTSTCKYILGIGQYRKIMYCFCNKFLTKMVQ